MRKGIKQRVIECPDCNLPCAFHRVDVHRKGNFCWGSEYKIQTDEDMVLYKYWKGKTVSSLHSEVKFLLTPLQLKSLLAEASISILDVGNGKGKYNLSRYQDKGNYEIGNCRFITQLDNIMEKEYGLRYIVEGTEHSVTQDVADKYNCSRATVRRRCESPKFPDWKLVTLT